MTKEKFANIPVVQHDFAEFAKLCEGSLSFILLTCTRKNEATASFPIMWEGDPELMFNSCLAFFRNNGQAAKIMEKAYLEYLHERTVEGYTKGEITLIANNLTTDL